MMRVIILLLMLTALAPGQSDYTFKWNCAKGEALSYAVTEQANKNNKTKFVIYGSELNDDGTNALGIVTYKDIAYHLAFMLPKDKIKVGGQWKYEKIFFEEGFDEAGTLIKVKVIGSYIFRRIAKEKKGKEDVEFAVVEGAFNVFDVRRSPQGKDETQKNPAGRIDISYFLNLGTMDLERVQITMDVNGHDIGEMGGGPMPKKFSIRDALVLDEKIKYEANDKIINAINKAIEKGAAGLKKMQKPDGSFVESVSGDNKIGATALAVMALLHSGAKVSDPMIQKAFAYMSKEFRAAKTHKTYDAGLLCMAIETKYLPLEQYDDMAKFTEDEARVLLQKNISKEDLAILNEAATWLKTNQAARGNWGYPDLKENYDHSNTQYALLGLKSCARCGIAISPDVWLRAVQHWVDSHGTTDSAEVKLRLEFFNPKEAGITTTETEIKAKPGGWGYLVAAPQGLGVGGGGVADFFQRKYGSMTCAGLTSLIVCESELFAAKKLDDKLRESIEKAKRSALVWLQEHFSVRANVPAAHFFVKFFLYYLYSLERVGVLYGIKKFGDHDWYHEGAILLIDAQKGDGTWDLSLFNLPLSDTAFALLFLKKATLKVNTGR